MNKRQSKKLKTKLMTAIEELNNDIFLSEGMTPCTEEEVKIVYNKIKNNKKAIKETLGDYKKYIR